ncbi:MAG: hypothetical protein M3072_16985, partial [Candidatus Dormibacteraeota bacterium]|nr:hypothetical protein [Candidatus Dormibacteraeota bacterium]
LKCSWFHLGRSRLSSTHALLFVLATCEVSRPHAQRRLLKFGYFSRIQILRARTLMVGWKTY